jgi:thymidine phosphorylase
MVTERSLPQELLRRKRNGLALDENELRDWMKDVASDRLGDAQIGAFAMAVCLRGMDAAETVALTRAMRDSGSCIDWRDAGLHGPLLDKHSTGGVGDLTSLVLGPLVAACGAHLPMLSGRGLGHTGGTLDKLEAIPGYRCEIDRALLQRVVREAGVAIVAAGGDLAPADRRLYAVRDVTATVDSIPLITASILSKKLAAGAGALVLDVKVGSGATFTDCTTAAALARSLVDVATGAGVPTTALLTDMDQPLAACVGNALEMRIALDYLRGDCTPSRLHQLVLLLATEMLLQGGLARDAEDARRQLCGARDSGRAAQCFARMVHLLGGPPDLLEHPDGYLPSAPHCTPVFADHAGVVTAIDARALGMALVALGGGRTSAGERIDPRVGIDRIAAVGGAMEPGIPLAFVHAADATSAEAVQQRVRAAFVIGDVAPPPAPLLLQTVRAGATA